MASESKAPDGAVLVGRVDDFGTGLHEVDVGSHKALLVKTKKGKVYATGAKCSHYGAPLAKGVLNGERVVCPWHGACFHAGTGDIESGATLNAIPSFTVTVNDGNVYVSGVTDAMRRTPSLCTATAADPRHFVVVGGGTAGAAAVQELRVRGYQGSITLITDQPTLPYDRTKLSKDLSVAASDIELRGRTFYEEHGIRLMLGTRVVRVDVAAKELIADAPIKFDKLLLATGGTPRSFRAPEPFTLPGADLTNVYTLRHAADASAIMSAVGSGFIGMETAVYLNKQGVKVTVLDMVDAPFQRVLGTAFGSFVQHMHEANGIAFRMGVKVTEFSGGDAGSVTGVHVDAGDAGGSAVVCADVVVIGAGVMPATGFLRDTAGLTLAPDGSVEVNEFLQAAPDVYAAGDVARYPDPMALDGSRIRVEHWDVALDHGRLAAVNMLKDNDFERFDVPPMFWTAQGKNIRYAGHATDASQMFVQGEMKDADSAFTAYYHDGGNTLTAVATFNRDPQAVAALQLMKLRRMPTKAEVEAVAMFDLVAALAECSD